MRVVIRNVARIGSFYNTKTKSRFLAYTFLLLWTLPLLLGGWEEQSIKPHDEGLYATRARLMWSTGDWVNPWSNPHHKTPGIYWLLATLYQFWGINETVIRLPSIIFSLICVILVYEIGNLVFNSYVGFLGAAILNLQFLWLQYSRLANPDLAAIALILLAIFLLLKSESKFFKYRNVTLTMAGACLGLAILFRGLMIVIPLVALTPYLLLENRRHRYLQQPWLYLGFALGTLPCLVWLYLSWLRFGNQTFNRLLGLVVTFGGDNRHDHNVLFYPISFASSAFPWGLIAVVGLYLLWRNHLKSAWSLTVGFPLICFILLSIYSTRLHHYALILYPFTALLSGLALSAWLPAQQRQNFAPQWFFPAFSYILGSIGLLLMTGAIIVFWYYPSEQQYAQIAIAASLPWLCLPLIYRFRLAPKIWVGSCLLGSWLGLLTAVNISLVGNYEPDIKEFLQQPEVAQIVNQQPVYILHGGGKTQTLFRFYLTNLQYLADNAALPSCSYAVSDAEYLTTYEVPYRSVANFRDWQLIQTTNCPHLDRGR